MCIHVYVCVCGVSYLSVCRSETNSLYVSSACLHLQLLEVLAELMKPALVSVESPLEISKKGYLPC